MAQTRRAAIHAAEEAFGWTCQTPDVAEPVLTTHRPRNVRLIHPLRHDPAVPTGGTFDQMLADIYNFDRRPGRVYLATYPRLSASRRRRSAARAPNALGQRRARSARIAGNPRRTSHISRNTGTGA